MCICSLTNTQLFTSQDINWCTGVVDYCDVFISCLNSRSDGTHSLQRIHWWASDVMLNFSKSVLMKKQAHLYLECPGVSKISANFLFLDELFIWEINQSFHNHKKLQFFFFVMNVGTLYIVILIVINVTNIVKLMHLNRLFTGISIMA